MTRVFRTTARVAVVVLAAFLIWSKVWLPLHCNEETIVLERTTLAAYAHSDRAASAPLARRNLERANACLRVNDGDVAMLMIAGANQMLLGDFAGAQASYRRALMFDERPETHLQLAVAEARLGDDAAAGRDAFAAVQFNPLFLDGIGDGVLRARIDMLVQQEYAARGNLTFNPVMADGSARTREFKGVGPGGPSAASGWFFSNGTAGSTLTERVENAPGNGGPALHVVAGCSFCGVLQSWGPIGSGPAHVQSSMRVFVKSGRVMISTGPLGHSQLDAISTATGRWETVGGSNPTCPVNHVKIVSYQGPAEFYLRDVSVKAIPGESCGNPISATP